MRKSIKRIVSTVLAASMALTSCVVSNVVTAMADYAGGGTCYQDQLPAVVDGDDGADASNTWILAGTSTNPEVYVGNVTLTVTFDSENVSGDGSIITFVKEGTPAGTNADTNLGVRCIDKATGACVFSKSSSSAPALGNYVQGTNTVVFTVNTETGEATCKLNDNPEATATDTTATNIKGAKFNKKKGRLMTVTAMTISGTLVSDETTTVAPTTEATTEATTVAPTTVTTTEATTVEPTTEATTEAVTVAANEIAVVPNYVVSADGKQITVNYDATVGESAFFNHYTIFVEYDPAVLKPVSATDGDIKLTAKDATGADAEYTASNASAIESQFTDVPSAGNTDFEGTDGTKTQAELGKIKVAYVIGNGAALNDGSLPAYNTSGTLFSITYDVIGDVNGKELKSTIGTMNSVSSDGNVSDSSVAPVNGVTTISDVPVPDVTETTTSEATTETATEAPTEVVTGLALVGDKEVDGSAGTATVNFKLTNNTAGVANYTVIVKYDPTKVIATSGSVNSAFDYEAADVVNNQIAYVPTANDPDYAGADGTKTAAQIGALKIAAISTKGNVMGDLADALTLNFNVLDTTPGSEYPVTITVVSMGNADGQILPSEKVDGSIVIKSTTPTEGTTEGTTTAPTEGTTTAPTTSAPATTEATTSESTETTTRVSVVQNTGGGGGGKVTTTTTTTEATTVEEDTEATTEATNTVIPGEAPNQVVVMTPNGAITVTIPTEKDPNFTGFNDLGNYPWAADSINKLAELGIISGVAEGTYGPALPCRRADFAILINRTLGVSTTSTAKNFYDNEDDSKYYYNDVIVGYNAGILSGYGDNNYKPEQYCTREEMAVLVAKSFEWLGNDVTSTDLGVNDKYSDVDNISWWSAPYVAYLTNMGVLNGNADGTLLPQNYINRAEMAVMMAKVYDYALAFVEEVHANATTTEETTEETTEDEDATETTTVEESTETTTVAED